MGKVRFAVVGTGGMGKSHMKYMKDSDLLELVAVCDVNKAEADRLGAERGVPSYGSYTECLDPDRVDAVMIATPHYFHPPIAIDAMKKGIHVLTEKPVAVSVRDADRMAATAKKTGVKYGVMFQRRTIPALQKAKEIVSSGQLGEIWRTAMIETKWFRTQAYYDSGTWRATWAGEGGGVMMNQAPHSFDMFTWLTGLPVKVLGRTSTLHHDIEVEDTACALLTYANGGVGYVMTSTWEAPGVSSIQVVGSKGMLSIDDDRVRLALCDPPGIEFIKSTKESWAFPKCEWKEVEAPEAPSSGHRAVTENFCRAILNDEPLIAPGVEGAVSLEMVNAIALSSHLGREVKLPVSRAAFDRLLNELKKSSKAKH